MIELLAMKKYRVIKEMLLEIKEEGMVRRGAKGKKEGKRGISSLSKIEMLVSRLGSILQLPALLASFNPAQTILKIYGTTFLPLLLDFSTTHIAAITIAPTILLPKLL